MSSIILPEKRRVAMRNLLCRDKKQVRILEAHNGLSAIISSSIAVEVDGSKKEFDGLWISGLTESLSRGLPDIELNGISSRIGLIREIINVTNKAIVIDGDTGGTSEQLCRNLRILEGMGVSGIVLEDKVFPKNNSLDSTKKQILEDPDVFAQKLIDAKNCLLAKDIMIFARIESLIAGMGLEDAVMRAKKYLAAGADGIVIHSREKDPQQVLDFAREYRALNTEVPLVAIPTTYHSIREEELFAAGFRMVIYANHMLRSAHYAMTKVAETILRSSRALEADELTTPVKDILTINNNL